MNVYLSTSAEMSGDGRYRYALGRQWATPAGQPERPAVFIMLNPSTADAHTDDATVRRCVTFAQREHCNRLTIVNLFALRSKDPRALRAGWLAGDDVTGPNNHDAIHNTIIEAADNKGLLIAAWGANWPQPNMPPRFNWERIARTERIIPRCLGRTAHGQPKHPVRLADNTPLERWEPIIPSGNYCGDLILP